MSTDIETAFHTSLDRLLRGEATLDACLAAYPEHDERLRDMLVVALDLQSLAPLPLDQRAVDRGARLIDDELRRLRTRLDRQPEPASAWQRLAWWFPRFMPVRMAGLAAAVAVALIAYGGVTLAAVNSGPDSALYGYRLTLEELRIGFASDEEKAYLYLDTAEQRLREIESAAGLGDAGAVARASSAYQEVVRKGVDVLGAVARETAPGAERTGEVAADYRRRLAEHDTRFDSLTTKAADAQRAPITRARSLVQAGLQDVHSGPILAAAPTATPDPSPAPTTPAPVSSPSPTPAAFPAPPVSPTPAAPTASPTATPTTAPTPQATPEATATATPAPAIDITGSAVVVTGELHAVTAESLVVAGIPILRSEDAAVDGVPLSARVRAEALVAADGRLTLVGLSVVQPVAAATEPAPESTPLATPAPTPSPEPTPAEGTPPPTDEPPADTTPTETPEASPSPTPNESTPADGAPTATPEATPSPDTTPADATPTPSEQQSSTEPSPTPAGTETPPAEPQPTAEVSATPTPAEGDTTATPSPETTPETSPTPGDAPTATPKATPIPDTTPADATPTPTDGSQPTPEPPTTTTPQEGSPTPTPEVTPTPDPTPTDAPASPTPTEGEPTPAPEATPSPETTPTAAPSEPPPTPSPAPGEPPAATEPTPTPDAEPPVAPLPPTLQGVLVAIDSFSVRAGGIVFSRPLDTPLVLHGPIAPGDVVVVTFESLRAASSYVLVVREVALASPPDVPVVTRWQGFVDELESETLTLNGLRLHVLPAAREHEVWAGLEVGDLVEVDLADAMAAEPAAAAIRRLGSGAPSFSNLTATPFG